MKVYIVMCHADYECDWLDKVFDSKEKAVKYVENKCGACFRKIDDETWEKNCKDCFVSCTASSSLRPFAFVDSVTIEEKELE